MSAWSQDDLGRLGGAGEVEVSSVRRDGTLSRARTVWIVRVGDQLYLRSVNGPDAAWYRLTKTFRQSRIEARDVTWVDIDAAGQPEAGPAVDAEYARKYQGATSAIAHITSPLARATTMRAEPR